MVQMLQLTIEQLPQSNNLLMSVYMLIQQCTNLVFTMFFQLDPVKTTSKGSLRTFHLRQTTTGKIIKINVWRGVSKINQWRDMSSDICLGLNASVWLKDIYLNYSSLDQCYTVSLNASYEIEVQIFLKYVFICFFLFIYILLLILSILIVLLSKI